MAEFGEHADAFGAAGADLVALSVDPPAPSDDVRRRYGIRFPILCDVEHRVVRDWNLYNAKEKGGIAVPAVFLLGRDLQVLYACTGTVVSRIRAEDLLAELSSLASSSVAETSSPPSPSSPDEASTVSGISLPALHNRAIVPHLSDFARGFWAALRFAFRRPKK